jgi:hypothetical protein
VGVSTLSGCASFYIDPATKDVAPSEFKHVDQPKPTQFVFEFQTKGAPNARATEKLKQQVTDEVKSSGLFASIVDQPGADTGMLQITLNNVPITSKDEALAKGFATGLTFGLIGSSVTDGYICTVSYLPPGGQKPMIIKTAHHAIHTTLGAASAPEGTIKADSLMDAANTMTRQIVANALRDLSQDAAF